MGGLIFFYELKLLPYHDLTALTWYILILSFLSFLFGILTIISARSLKPRPQVFDKKSHLYIDIFLDGGSVVKYAIIIFSLISLTAAIHNWLLLIKMFGSIPLVFLNANKIYSMNIRGEIKGILPYYISHAGYAAVFFSGIYTAYKGKFSLLTFLPFIGIIVKELALVGRVGMLIALLEFLFTFFLFRHLLKSYITQKFKFSKLSAGVSLIILLMLFIISASVVRITRSSTESFMGASKQLKDLNNNFIISPTMYLYFSSDVGVLNEYLKADKEIAGFGQNTFLPVHLFLAKLGAIEKPYELQRGYFIPMWTNTGTYLRELHADFGVVGLFLGPYLLGLLITWLWFQFYEKQKIVILAILVHLYIIIALSFLVMTTRLSLWFFSLFLIIVSVPILEKLARINKKSSAAIHKMS